MVKIILILSIYCLFHSVASQSSNSAAYDSSLKVIDQNDKLKIQSNKSDMLTEAKSLEYLLANILKKYSRNTNMNRQVMAQKRGHFWKKKRSSSSSESMPHHFQFVGQKRGHFWKK